MSDATNAVGSSDGESADDELVTELRALAARLDPVPPEAAAAARSAIAWRTMDAELAELIDDPASDPSLAGVRSTDTPLLLTFESPLVDIEIEIVRTGDHRRILGQLVPPGFADVEVRHPGGIISVAADEVGTFRAEQIPPGPVNLRCSSGAGIVETDWFLA